MRLDKPLLLGMLTVDKTLNDIITSPSHEITNRGGQYCTAIALIIPVGQFMLIKSPVHLFDTFNHC